MENKDWHGKDILEECTRLRKVLQPVSDTFFGPLDRSESSNTLFPFVLLLGNHSSGKSSFINYILKRKVQQTGVAPTDDCFTIISPGETDADKNGPAFIGDPDLGFGGLKGFGPVLVNHTQLKVRSNIAVKDFMIVDSPGMIDSPVSRSNSDMIVGENNEVLDRGYDFAGVCRWYAERADVILLFFDPDKPGTTGETLSILTKSLKGFDHKLHIILNKADQFRKIHDFARAYGSLCWNLSKVIARKDLPRIHTMCLPIHSLPIKQSRSAEVLDVATEATSPTRRNHVVTVNDKDEITSISDDLTTIKNQPLVHQNPTGEDFYEEEHAKLLTRAGKPNPSFIDQEFLDLEEARTEVIREVFNAPKRRVDNEISRLYEDVVALDMHCKLIQEVVSRYHVKLWSARMWSVGAAVMSTAVTMGMQYFCNYLAQRNIQWTISGSFLLLQSMFSPWNHSTFVSLPDSPSSVNNNDSLKPENQSVPEAKAPKQSTNLRGSKAPAPIKSAVAVEKAELPVENIISVPINPDEIYQRVILTTGITGLFTTACMVGWKYWQLHRYLQTYAPIKDTARRRPRWSVFGFASFTQTTHDTVLEKDSIHSNDSNSMSSHHSNRHVYESIMTDLYAREYKRDDKFTLALANHVVDNLCDNVTPEVVPNLPTVSKKQFDAFYRIINEDIANLRRRATPSFPVLSPPLTLFSTNHSNSDHISEGNRTWSPSPNRLETRHALSLTPVIIDNTSGENLHEQQQEQQLNLSTSIIDEITSNTSVDDIRTDDLKSEETISI